MAYFSKFPSITYTIDNYKNKNITNIFNRAATKILSFDERDLINVREDRPEMISHRIYRDVNKHWILLLLNNIVDPFYDWNIPSDTLRQIILKKYPNRVFLINSNHYDVNTSDKKMFYPGETVSQGGSTATVVKFDPDLLQLVVSSVSGNFTIDSNVTGSGSTAIGEITEIRNEYESISHYLHNSTKSKINYRSTTIEASNDYTEITIFAKEVEDNELKDTIFVLEATDIIRFENEFDQILSGNLNG